MIYEYIYITKIHSWTFAQEKSAVSHLAFSLDGAANVNKSNMIRSMVYCKTHFQKTEIVQCSTWPAGIQFKGLYCTNCSMNCWAIIRPLALMAIFMPLISLSMSSINWMMKSISLCFQSFSRWEWVTRKLISNPWSTQTTDISTGKKRGWSLYEGR